MAEQKKIKETIAINNDFDLLTRSYQEHAIGQINFARYSVLYAREFSDELGSIFANVKNSYKSKILRKDIKNIVKKNGRDIWILVTANNKLYGDIILRSFKLFEERIKENRSDKVDLVIIGRQGKNYMEASGMNKPFEYFELPDNNVTVDYLKKISEKLIYYENIYVVYGKFNNLVSQTPVQISLTGDVLESASNDPEAEKKRNFLFEPSIEEILSFFENQILALLLNQTVQEAQLARFASRINAMETAQVNIQKQLARLVKKDKLFRVREMNKKQSELLAGRALWNK